MAGKKFKAAREAVDREKRYSVEEAFQLLEKTHVVKFDETVDVAVRLGIDPKQSDQMVRGAVGLPHGLGKKARIVVFAKGEKQKEASEAGADQVGAEDLIAKIEGGWLDFDKAVATPDMMGQVSKLGKILGPRGLMPNPKIGTVTFELAKAIGELKAGKAEYKIDKAGIVHTSIGKVSFGAEKLRENFQVLMESIVRAKPQTSKGSYLRSVTVSLTMGPGIKLDPTPLQSS